MNTSVNSKLAKLLKEKGFNELCSSYYYTKSDTEPIETNVKCSNNRIADSCYSAPTIAQVVMWIWNNYKIWINVRHLPFNQQFGMDITGGYNKENGGKLYTYDFKHYVEPNEAYEAAIEYVLKNLI